MREGILPLVRVGVHKPTVSGDKSAAEQAFIKRRTFLALLGVGAMGLAARFAALPRLTGPDASAILRMPAFPSGGAFQGFKWFRGFKINTVETDSRVDPAKWSLTVDGLVAKPLQWNHVQLLALPAETQVSDFHCVEGWGVDNLKWEGIRLQTLLGSVGVDPKARYIIFHTVQGVYTDSLSLEQARRPEVMLAYRRDGQALSQDQGFPLRLIIPSMYGYKNVKWVNRLELTDKPHQGYWEDYGYAVDGWLDT